MRFTINLATRTYLDHRLVNQSFAAGILILVALLVWNVSRISWDLGELRRLKSDIASFEGRLNSRPAGVSEAEFAGVQKTIRFYNRLIEGKSYNWLGLLEQLESSTPEGIALATLVPDRNGEIKIEGRARSFAQVRSYLEMLEDSRFFSGILLLSHKDLQLGERNRGVQFTISCKGVAP